MPKFQTHIASEDQMRALGARIATALSVGDVVMFSGDLGVGKTFLIRAIIRALAGDITLDVPSPSFTLIQDYQLDDLTVHHIDLYRLSAEDELFELGIPEIFEQAISLIEWPERLGGTRPRTVISITIEDGGEAARTVEIEGLAL